MLVQHLGGNMVFTSVPETRPFFFFARRGSWEKKIASTDDSDY